MDVPFRDTEQARSVGWERGYTGAAPRHAHELAHEPPRVALAYIEGYAKGWRDKYTDLREEAA